MNKEKMAAVCDMIAADAENGVTRYERRPFDGKTMAAYQGEQNAMIQALANVLGEVVRSL